MMFFTHTKERFFLFTAERAMLRHAGQRRRQKSSLKETLALKLMYRLSFFGSFLAGLSYFAGYKSSFVSFFTLSLIFLTSAFVVLFIERQEKKRIKKYRSEMRLRALLLLEEKPWINELSQEALSDIQQNTLSFGWYEKFFKLAKRVSEQRNNLNLRRTELNAEDIDKRFNALSMNNTVFIHPSNQNDLNDDLLMQDKEEEQKEHVWRM